MSADQNHNKQNISPVDAPQTHGGKIYDLVGGRKMYLSLFFFFYLVIITIICVCGGGVRNFRLNVFPLLMKLLHHQCLHHMDLIIGC